MSTLRSGLSWGFWLKQDSKQPPNSWESNPYSIAFRPITILSRSAYAFVTRRSAQATDQTTALLQKSGTSYTAQKRAKEGGRVFRSTFLVNERVLEPLSWTKQDIRAIFLQRQEGGEWYPAFLAPQAHILEWHFRHRVGELAKHETCATEQPGPLLRCAKAQPIRV